MSLFGDPPNEWLRIVKRADELGYHAVWLSDHLITPMEYRSRYPYHESGRASYSPDTPLMDPWVAISHLAAVTTRIKLGTGVYILPLRNPFVTARAVATAHYLSGGRVLFGVGSGWMAEEFEAVGEDFSNRGRRMDEILDILTLLWSGKSVDHRGKFWRFQPVRFSPAPTSGIPIIMGGESERALGRAAYRGDGWYGLSGLERSLEIVRRLARLRDEAGRGDLPFQIWIRCLDEPTVDNVRRHQDAGITRLAISLWPRQAITVDQKLEALERFAEQVMTEF